MNRPGDRDADTATTANLREPVDSPQRALVRGVQAVEVDPPAPARTVTPQDAADPV